MEDGAMLIRSWVVDCCGDYGGGLGMGWSSPYLAWAKLCMRVRCCRNKPIKIIILDYCKWIYCNMKIGMRGILEKWKAKREKVPFNFRIWSNFAKLDMSSLNCFYKESDKVVCIYKCKCVQPSWLRYECWK